jgi:hypothetical protein
MTAWPDREHRESTGDEVARLRRELEARVDVCWDRLDDAVSELCALHDVSGPRILEHVRATISAECVPAAESRASPLPLTPSGS